MSAIYPYYSLCFVPDQGLEDLVFPNKKQKNAEKE